MIPLRLHERDVKTVLRKARTVDPWFVGKLGFSPYQACAHGCTYCDGRAERYFVEGEFDRDIVVRRNAPVLLRQETAKLRERGTVFIGSGISDAYQPPESTFGLMAECGRVLAEQRLPVTLLTKSALVTRDVDIWSDVNTAAGFVLMVSLATLDDRLRSLTEPGASAVEERLAALRMFKARGCDTGVGVMPLLPYLSDDVGAIEALASSLGQAGVDFVLVGGLTLRPGRQKAAFFEMLRRSFPDLVPRYERLYGEERASGAPLAAYTAEVQQRAAVAFARVGLPTLMPHRLYHGRLPLYDEVDVILQQFPRLYARYPGAQRRLDPPKRRYREWLESRKEEFARHRKMREADLARELVTLASSSEWPAWLGNARLASFLREVIIDRRVFDDALRQLR
jgi:DNA repair photolyase